MALLLDNAKELTGRGQRLDERTKNSAEKLKEERGCLTALQRNPGRLERNLTKSMMRCKKAMDAKEQAEILRDKVGRIFLLGSTRGIGRAGGVTVDFFPVGDESGRTFPPPRASQMPQGPRR